MAAQIADALRGLIHQANLARDQHRDTITPDVRDALITRFRHWVMAGLADTRAHGDRLGQRKTRLLLEVLRRREADVLGTVTAACGRGRPSGRLSCLAVGRVGGLG